jgi:hypothetical protein
MRERIVARPTLLLQGTIATKGRFVVPGKRGISRSLPDMQPLNNYIQLNDVTVGVLLTGAKHGIDLALKAAEAVHQSGFDHQSKKTW